jgi:hypothetical protein
MAEKRKMNVLEYLKEARRYERSSYVISAAPVPRL